MLKRADYVKCINCDEVMYVPVGAETCPKCHKSGCMVFVNENEPSVEVSEADIEALSVNDLKEMLEEHGVTLNGLSVVSQLTGLPYENFVYNDGFILNSSIVRCAEGDYIIPLFDKAFYDLYSMRRIDKTMIDSLQKACRKHKEADKIAFLEDLKGLDRCDQCGTPMEQEDLINIDPQNFEENNLLSEFESFDGMVCTHCHKKMQKLKLQVTYCLGYGLHYAEDRISDIVIDKNVNDIHYDLLKEVSKILTPKENYENAIIIKKINGIDVKGVPSQLWRYLADGTVILANNN